MIATREDLEALLASIGPPGEKQEEKLEVVRALDLKNSQGVNIAETLSTYGGF